MIYIVIKIPTTDKKSCKIFNYFMNFIKKYKKSATLTKKALKKIN